MEDTEGSVQQTKRKKKNKKKKTKNTPGADALTVNQRISAGGE